MGDGIWYNPRSGAVFNFGAHNTHDVWLRSADNRIKLGLRPATIEYIESLPRNADSVDEIRLAAIRDGMVRIRDYGGSVTVQFQARRGLRDLLFKINELLNRFYDASKMIRLHNLATGESTDLSLVDMGSRLREDAPVLFREDRPQVQDIPFDPALNLFIDKKIGVKRVIDNAESIVENWRNEGKTRGDLLREFSEILDICDDLKYYYE